MLSNKLLKLSRQAQIPQFSDIFAFASYLNLLVLAFLCPFMTQRLMTESLEHLSRCLPCVRSIRLYCPQCFPLFPSVLVYFLYNVYHASLKHSFKSKSSLLQKSPKLKNIWAPSFIVLINDFFWNSFLNVDLS
jgi:hypothetical protein